MQQQISKEMQTCIDNCLECASTCEKTLAFCLSQGGSFAEAKHISLLMDCVDICLTSARSMTRGSEHHSVTCRACADICRACADECNAMEGDVMKRCASVCERCATSCESMAGAGRIGLGTQSPIRHGHVEL